MNDAPVDDRLVPAKVRSRDETGPNGCFNSILFERPEDRPSREVVAAPEFFADLHCDQIVNAATAGKEEYDLKPLFYIRLRSVDAVEYRHAVMRDLDDDRLAAALRAFASSMRSVRDHLAQLDKAYHAHQKGRWLLDAVDVFAEAVERLLRDLSAAALASRGLVDFRSYLAGYASSQWFHSLAAEAKRLKAALAAIRYAILIRGSHVQVFDDTGAPDYSCEVEKILERFQQNSPREYEFRFSDAPEMNHVEERILETVAQLHAETFSQVASFRARAAGFLDPVVTAFDREIQFYLAYRDYIARFKQAGLRFCYPRVSASRKEVCDYDGFDLALAGKIIEQAVPVCNDFTLEGRERMIVVSGPNQGGKTTFARTFGQLHYLASLGLPVPGSRARLYLFDRIFVHFEREEHTVNLRGKLEDDLARVRDILTSASPHSIVIINEIFASTSLRDAVFLSKKIAAALLALDALCVWVTFLEEAASLGEKVVSMVSTVAPENPAQRTFKIVRRPADGLAYAMSLAEKHRLTHGLIKQRIPS